MARASFESRCQEIGDNRRQTLNCAAALAGDEEHLSAEFAHSVLVCRTLCRHERRARRRSEVYRRFAVAAQRDAMLFAVAHLLTQFSNPSQQRRVHQRANQIV
jgi:hypothetical protein